MIGTMLRTEAVQRLAHYRDGMLTVATMQPTAVWSALGQADERNLNLLGSMGSAAALGLGLALARPDQRVLVIDGDGSLLMQLGSLPSIAGLQPRNFYHVVFENGVYQTSGAQPVPGSGLTDLCAVAIASGYRHAARFASVDEIDDETTGLQTALSRPGPALVSLVIAGQGTIHKPADPPPPGFAVQLRNMRAHLASLPSA